MRLKQTLDTLLAAALLIGGLAFFVAPVAQAANCGGVETSIDFGCSDQTGSGTCPDGEVISAQEIADGKKCSVDGSDPRVAIENTGIWGILLTSINILTGLIGVAAVGGIVYGSILYTSAGGNTEQTKKATGVFTNVVIGVIAYAGMYALLNFLIPGGLFR